MSNTIDKLCHSFIQGKPLDIYVKNLEDERFKRLVTEYVTVRKCERAYFLDGRFIDTIGFTVHNASDVQARAIKRRDGRGLMVNFWNPGAEDDVQSVVTISLHDAFNAPRPIYPNDAAVSESGGFFTVTWPGPVASVVWG